MTRNEVDAFLDGHKKVPIHSPELIGYELISADIDSRDHYGRLSIIHMIWDCDGTRGNRTTPYKLAESPNGVLTLWTLPHNPEEYTK